MKKIVIDTSVVMKWYFPEKGFEKALELKDNHIKGNITLHSRDLLIYEFTSAFKNHSSSIISAKDFSLAVSVLVALKIKLLPLSFQEMKELFNLSRELDLSIYDASFILLSIKIKAPLYTSDKKLWTKGKKSTEVIFL